MKMPVSKKACVIPALGTTTRRFLSLWGFLQITHFLWPFGVEANGRVIDFGFFISSFELESHLASGSKESGSLDTSLHNGTLGTLVCDREKDLKHLWQITSSSLHGCTYQCWGFNRSPRLISTTTSSMTPTAVVCFRHNQADSFWNKLFKISTNYKLVALINIQLDYSSIQ